MKSRKQDYRGLSWHWLITKLSSGSGATTDRLGFAGRLALEKRKVIFNLWQRPGSWANRSPLQSPECSLHCNGIYFSVRQGHVSECLMRNALAWNLLEWSQNRSLVWRSLERTVVIQAPLGVSIGLIREVPDQVEQAPCGCKEIPADSLSWTMGIWQWMARKEDLSLLCAKCCFVFPWIKIYLFVYFLMDG